ncbi:MAG: hypothetical protein ACOYOF_07960 [Verrucomicrobiaceae bacterium]
MANPDVFAGSFCAGATSRIPRQFDEPGVLASFVFMDAAKLRAEIRAMTDDLDVMPTEDLILYAGGRGWLNMSRTNMAMSLLNAEPQHRKRQARMELHFLILRGYLRDILEGNLSE